MKVRELFEGILTDTFLLVNKLKLNIDGKTLPLFTGEWVKCTDNLATFSF